MSRLLQQVDTAHQQFVSRSTPEFAAFSPIIEQHATDAAFLWLLRSQVVYNSTLYFQEDIDELDERINAHLNGLLVAGQSGWEICLQQLEMEDAGEAFVAAVIAFNSGDTAKMKTVCNATLEHPEMTPGLVSALGWINETISQSWIERFLSAKNPWYQYLGVAACSLRRLDPGRVLTDLLQHDDIDQHSQLHARCLRLVGEMKRVDLIPALNQAMNAEDEDVKFWASWSAALLGNKAAIEQLKPYVLEENEHQDTALLMVFNSLSIEQARQWISEISKDSAYLRLVILAAGVIGEPQVIPWLIKQMHDTAVARIGGLAFTIITGVDLEQSQLDKEVEIEFEDNPEDEIEDDAEHDDSDLPWPDPIKLRSFWENNGQSYQPGEYYFLGEPVEPDTLKGAVQTGNQLQRSTAALKLAVLESDEILLNTATPGIKF